jgi:hypothetical protein
MLSLRLFCSGKRYEMQIFFANISDLAKITIGEPSKLDGLVIKVKLLENEYFNWISQVFSKR